MKQNINSITTGKVLNPNELKYGWQEFVISRQERNHQNKIIAKSTDFVENLLSQIQDSEVAEQLRDAIIAKECDVNYICYNRGFYDGIKLAIMLENI